MKRIVIALAFILFQFSPSYGQLSIETRLCYSDTTRFQFSGEWQYLSTDVYLFNGNKFSKVINDLFSKEPKKKRKKIAEEQLEYLYITAQLINVKFFGENNVVYPLYNFRINQDRDQKYQTFVSDNIESIRIIDNLPLYSASDKIDAKIDVNAISQSNRDNILGIIGAQLRNLASLMRPSNAVLSLIGEMGSFIESNSRKKEYKFSSTIRLFEQKNFDTRLHSIRIYALTAPNTPTIRINDEKLKKYFDTCRMPDLSRGTLEKLINYPHYPLIVVANYKSLYHMASISGDEVSFASIDKRKVDIENNFRNKLISEDTYRQERDFIDFITVFAIFKSQLELYTLNARMGNADAAMNALGTTTQHYCSLLYAYDKTNYKYRNNKTFATIFRTEYTSILDFATFYLENDHNLRAAKAMIATMNDLNVKGMPKAAPEMENALLNLRFIDNMNNDFKTKAKEGQSIHILINNLENNLFSQSFSPDINALKTTPAINEKAETLQRLKERMGTTHCVSCRDKASEAIKDYNNRYNAYLYAAALKKHDSLVVVSRKTLIRFIESYNNIVAKYNEVPQPTPYNNIDTLLYQKQHDLLTKKMVELSNGMQDLDNLVETDVKNKSIEVIKSAGEKITNIIASVNETITLIQSNILPAMQTITEKPVINEEALIE